MSHSFLIELNRIKLRSDCEVYNTSTLKGHCHAIWQLYKKLGGVYASIEFQN